MALNRKDKCIVFVFPNSSYFTLECMDPTSWRELDLSGPGSSAEGPTGSAQTFLNQNGRLFLEGNFMEIGVTGSLGHVFSQMDCNYHKGDHRSKTAWLILRIGTA